MNATRDAISVRRALTVAHALSAGAADNPEYARGQVELICDAFGLDMDTWRDQVTRAITSDPAADLTTFVAEIAAEDRAAYLDDGWAADDHQVDAQLAEINAGTFARAPLPETPCGRATPHLPHYGEIARCPGVPA